MDHPHVARLLDVYDETTRLDDEITHPTHTRPVGDQGLPSLTRLARQLVWDVAQVYRHIHIRPTYEGHF